MRYIDKVIKHINSEEKAKEIESELYDHIDEHESFYIDIGYDQNSAIEKAEEKMGDADIVGEQFSAILKPMGSSNIVFTFMLIFLGVGVVTFYVCSCFLYRTELYGITSSSQFASDCVFYPFWGTVIHTVLLCLSFISMSYGVKKKRIVHLLISYICSISLLFFGPYDWIEIFDFSKYIKKYYLSIFNFFGIHHTSVIQKAVITIAVMIVTILFLIGFNNTIKARRLKNTKKSMLASRVSNIILSIFSTLCILLLVATVTGIIAYRNQIINEFTNELVRADTFVINNYEKVCNGHFDEVVAEFEEEFKDGHIEENTYLYYYSDCGVSFLMNKELEDNAKASVDVQGYLFDPLCFIPREINIFDDATAEDMNDLKKVQLPAIITNEYLEHDKHILNFYYDYDYSSNSRIVFSYNEKSAKFEFLSSSFTEFNEKAELTDSQKSMLKNAVYSKSFDLYDLKNHKELQSMIIDNDKALQKYIDESGLRGTYISVFAVKKNEELNSYWIRLAYVNYDYPFTSGVYPQLNYSDEYFKDLVVSFTDDEAIILSEHNSVGREHWKSDEGIEEYFQFFEKDIVKELVADLNNR